MPKKPADDNSTKRLLIDPSGQTEMFEKSYQQELAEQKSKPVECLGRTFPNDAARSEYYLSRLKEHLQDPEFRKTPGFPKGTDEDILRMSDPPFYTACPNPFLGDFIKAFGKPYSPKDKYHRDPFAVDVSVGKTDSLYKAHGYHTKVPHLAIVPSILHYTEPGDIVLDGFSGSGMTGVAAQFCGAAPDAYRRQIEQEWKTAGLEAPKWGARRVVLNDLGPAATFISAGYNLPFDARAFESSAKRVLATLDAELGWMYETLHSDGRTKGRINFTVWSEVFRCPECSGDIVYADEASDDDDSVRKSFDCPHCKAELTRRRLERQYSTSFDPLLGTTVRSATRKPILIDYSVGDERFTKSPDAADSALLARIASSTPPSNAPHDRMMHSDPAEECWGDEWRAGVASFTHVHHLFLPRPLRALTHLWDLTQRSPDAATRRMLLYLAEQAVWGMSLMNRYAPTHFSQVNRYMSGRLRVLAQHSECSPWYILSGKLDRLVTAFRSWSPHAGLAVISTGDCSCQLLPSSSVDYVFTDPPFGDNFAYSELNFIVEAWHRVFTKRSPEAIVSSSQAKSLASYQTLMAACFREYCRVLKPGRWMTVVFSNSSNRVWHAIQEALGVAGFVVADVRTLDKKQGSFNQVHGVSVNQDLVISCYKPSEALSSSFSLAHSNADNAWAFVREHLGNLPVFVKQGGKVQVILERTHQMLLDRMTAFHIQRGVGVPLSASEFREGLTQRFAERDGMIFLSEQVVEYDRKRTTVSELGQLQLFVSDESSAIQWLRRELRERPQSFQDLQPQFMQETRGWAKHETPLDLRILLQQNFLCYDGQEEVPSQIHAYLSSNFKELRGKPKDDALLRAKAKDRWYVPDPKKSGDLEKLRERELLKEFEGYKANKAKQLKVFRVEAMRAGFKAAYDKKDYQAIVELAEKLPEAVLQEDDKLLMYYDVAVMRAGDRKAKTELF
jgi:16S rRNA G966 N2-methylase RsmD